MQRKTFRDLEKIVVFQTKHRVFLIALIIIILILLADFFLGGVTRFIFSRNADDLIGVIESFGIIGPIIFLVLIILEVMIAPIPGFILYVTGGALFGWFWGAILSLAGNMIGATLCFYLAKYLGRNFFERKLGKKRLESIDKYSAKFGGYAIFFLRINPFTSTDIISYAAGFSKMRFWDFFLGTLLGLLPLAFAQTYFGNAIINISPIIYWIFLGLSLAYLLGMIYLIYSSTHSKAKV